MPLFNMFKKKSPPPPEPSLDFPPGNLQYALDRLARINDISADDLKAIKVQIQQDINDGSTMPRSMDGMGQAEKLTPAQMSYLGKAIAKIDTALEERAKAAPDRPKLK